MDNLGSIANKKPQTLAEAAKKPMMGKDNKKTEVKRSGGSAGKHSLMAAQKERI